jgi:predicted dehydrogenase
MGESEARETAAPALHEPEDDSIHFLVAALKGEVDATHSLGGMETNVVVMQILDAALESARTGKTVPLRGLD